MEENTPAAAFFFVFVFCFFSVKQHGLCNADLHLSIQADIKGVLWSLWFKQGAGIVSFITHDL